MPILCVITGNSVENRNLLIIFSFLITNLLHCGLVEQIVILFINKQGFMQDKILSSHTCFGGHMDVNC